MSVKSSGHLTFFTITAQADEWDLLMLTVCASPLISDAVVDMVNGPTDVSVKWGIVPRVTLGKILHDLYLESLMGQFYTRKT